MTLIGAEDSHGQQPFKVQPAKKSRNRHALCCEHKLYSRLYNWIYCSHICGFKRTLCQLNRKFFFCITLPVSYPLYVLRRRPGFNCRRL